MKRKTIKTKVKRSYEIIDNVFDLRSDKSLIEDLKSNIIIEINNEKNTVTAKSYIHVPVRGYIDPNQLIGFERVTFTGVARLKENDNVSNGLAEKIARSKMERQFHKYLRGEVMDRIKYHEDEIRVLKQRCDGLNNCIDVVSKHITNLANNK